MAVFVFLAGATGTGIVATDFLLYVDRHLLLLLTRGVDSLLLLLGGTLEAVVASGTETALVTLRLTSLANIALLTQGQLGT